jgi:probable rRNA maturation factor
MTGRPTLLLRNEQSRLAIDEPLLHQLLGCVWHKAGYTDGEISLLITNNPTIHRLNQTHLQHDYPTDVLSFAYCQEPPHLEGEIVVSSDYAADEAARYGWPAEHELLLYLVHGALHLVGYDDRDEASALVMRERERAVLATAGLIPPGRD